MRDPGRQQEILGLPAGLTAASRSRRLSVSYEGSSLFANTEPVGVETFSNAGPSYYMEIFLAGGDLYTNADTSNMDIFSTDGFSAAGTGPGVDGLFTGTVQTNTFEGADDFSTNMATDGSSADGGFGSALVGGMESILAGMDVDSVLAGVLVNVTSAAGINVDMPAVTNPCVSEPQAETTKCTANETAATSAGNSHLAIQVLDDPRAADEAVSTSEDMCPQGYIPIVCPLCNRTIMSTAGSSYFLGRHMRSKPCRELQAKNTEVSERERAAEQMAHFQGGGVLSCASPPTTSTSNPDPAGPAPPCPSESPNPSQTCSLPGRGTILVELLDGAAD